MNVTSILASNGIILFDGTCAFCEGAVKFVARRDRAAYFRFGASQSEQGRSLLTQNGLGEGPPGTIVLIEDGHLYLKSTASLRIASKLSWPWKAAAILLWVPRPIRDAVYSVVAAIRHRLAGESNACEVPPPEIRQRLI
jgi:predicted DCC family thiol-disulfide oxidoreductase YuxK